MGRLPLSPATPPRFAIRGASLARGSCAILGLALGVHALAQDAGPPVPPPAEDTEAEAPAEPTEEPAPDLDADTDAAMLEAPDDLAAPAPPEDDGPVDWSRPEPAQGDPYAELRGLADLMDEGMADEPDYVELDTRKEVIPEYPDELVVLYGDTAIRCEADVWVDRSGKAKRIAMIDCPDGFHLAALEAMGKWVWERPPGAVPAEGVRTRARTGFYRRDRAFFPGVTYFGDPSAITSDPDLDVMIASGKMPRFPRQVNAGDDVCLVEVTVDAQGRSGDVVIDECAQPYRREVAKVMRSWRWFVPEDAGRRDSWKILFEVVFRI